MQKRRTLRLPKKASGKAKEAIKRVLLVLAAFVGSPEWTHSKTTAGTASSGPVDVDCTVTIEKNIMSSEL